MRLLPLTWSTATWRSSSVQCSREQIGAFYTKDHKSYLSCRERFKVKGFLFLLGPKHSRGSSTTSWACPSWSWWGGGRGGGGSRVEATSLLLLDHLSFLRKEESISFPVWEECGVEILCQGSVWNKWLHPWRQRVCPESLAFWFHVHLVVLQAGWLGLKGWPTVIHENTVDLFTLKLNPNACPHH